MLNTEMMISNILLALLARQLVLDKMEEWPGGLDGVVEERGRNGHDEYVYEGWKVGKGREENSNVSHESRTVHGTMGRREEREWECGQTQGTTRHWPSPGVEETKTSQAYTLLTE